MTRLAKLDWQRNRGICAPVLSSLVYARAASPQTEPASGQTERATCFLTGFTTRDLDAWLPAPLNSYRSVIAGKSAIAILSAFGSDRRQSAAVFDKLRAPAASVLTRCRETGELNAVRTVRSLGDEASKGFSPDGGISSRSPRSRLLSSAHPCGKDVKTRSERAGGVCRLAVYLYPQITVREAIRRRGLMLRVSL